MKRFLLLGIAVAALALPIFAKPVKIAVFIPGVRAGSPIYDNMAKGVEKLVAETPGASIKVYEAGFNQAEWEEKLTSLVATGEYDYLVTSNPSLPDLINKISPAFPKQKFICVDGQLAGNPNLYTVLYNQLEQGYVAGYLAGLVSMSNLPGANPDKKVGLIMGQHYPVMDKIIAPGFEQGLKAADPAFQLDARVVGNWFDATKAADLAKSMIAAGVDVILPICGSASQGALKAAQDAGKYLVFFDGDEYARAPKSILGCAVLHQEELTYKTLKAAIDGSLPFGKAEVVGMADGYIEFLNKSPSYLEGVPAAIRAKVDGVIAQIKSGKLQFKVPTL
ncbi:MAG: BMP family ABC transporter substrate-binding protein [Rectinemataceae bacterium]|nr:BMP family ABC transporter substrate-binding protein [Rectinemataceae bacterium]